MRHPRSVAIACIAMGSIGVIISAVLGIFLAPDVNPTQWRAPEAYRIIFLHVPFAWTSFLAFTVLFIGSLGWYCLLYTSPSPRDNKASRMPSSA